ncbi:MAG: hypothetical protein KDJ87_01465 [Rhizobiaceae bacterium]|nr:hypothetical protein [Rhizobiaceae bacterium]
MDIINSLIAVAATLLGLATSSALHNDRDIDRTPTPMVVADLASQTVNRSVAIFSIDMAARTAPAPAIAAPVR